MKEPVIIYINPECSKCQHAMCTLEEKGIQATVIEYLKDVPSEEEIREILKKLGISARELVRESEQLFKEHYQGRQLTEDEWISAMAKHPVLIQRPIIINGDKAVLGRSDEKINEITS